MKDISYDLLDLMEEYGADEEGIQKILEAGDRPEVLMALSPIRANLVEWVDIRPGDRVLEMGSGYGALTGTLAEKAGNVVVLDPRPENLEVNKKRHQGRGNIRYQCGMADELKGQEFDWVFLIGPQTKEAALGLEPSLEEKMDWAQKEEKSRYGRDTVCRAAGLVKPGGRLVLALMNSRGIKIWAGGEADKEELSMTYSDLKQIMESLGGKSTFYYPLPDYRLPSAVYSDGYLPVKGELPNLYAEYEKPRYRLFSEEAAYDALCEGGGFPQFANSFFVIWEKP